MVLFLLSMEALLSGQPDSILYHAILVLVALTGMVIAAARRPSTQSQPTPQMLALAGVALGQLVPALTASTSDWAFPVERAADMISLALLAWAFVPALQPRKWPGIAWLAISAALTLAFLAATALSAPADWLPATHYNLTLPARLWSTWQIVASGVAVIGMGLQPSDRASDPTPLAGRIEAGSLALVAFGAILIGYDFHLLTLVGTLPDYPQPDNVAAWARCGQLIALPMLVGALLCPVLAARLNRGRHPTPGAAGGPTPPATERSASPTARIGSPDPAAGVSALGCQIHHSEPPDAAIAIRRSVEPTPDCPATRFDLGLMLLAAGQVRAAREEYESAMARATQLAATGMRGAVPLAHLWQQLDESTAQLDRLLARLNQARPWDNGPPAGAAADRAAIAAAAQCLRSQIKSLSVALEYAGQPPSGHVSACVSSFRFANACHNPQRDFLAHVVGETPTYPTDEVWVQFDYDGMRAGQAIVWKITVDGREDPALRVVHPWILAVRGRAVRRLRPPGGGRLGPGTCALEMYIQSYLVQCGSFFVAEP